MTDSLGCTIQNVINSYKENNDSPNRYCILGRLATDLCFGGLILPVHSISVDGKNSETGSSL